MPNPAWFDIRAHQQRRELRNAIEREVISADTEIREKTLLEVVDLAKHFPAAHSLFRGSSGTVRAVDGVSFELKRGETLALVGESGCGKSTTGRMIMRLIEPTRGRITFDNQDVLALDKAGLRAIRRRMQIIFQDPYASLDPRMNVGAIVEEGLVVHGIGTRKERQEKVIALLEKVGLSADHARRYPHEFSGGQRQRIAIARCLALEPDLLIGDEPVSALDVSIQAQVINLLEDLQQEFGLTYLIISHNLAVVEHISDRVAVMYLGRIVEIAATDALFANPLHPYTEALLSAIPIPDPLSQRRRIILSGDVPSSVHPPSGCHFHTRCPHRRKLCSEVAPAWREVVPGRFLSCHYPIGTPSDVATGAKDDAP